MARIVELDEYKLVMVTFPKWEELIKETIKDIMAGLLKESHREMVEEVSNDYSKMFEEGNNQNETFEKAHLKINCGKVHL